MLATVRGRAGAQVRSHRAMPEASGPASPRVWRRAVEAFVALNLVVYGVPLLVGTGVSGTDAWGAPEATGPRRVPQWQDADHVLHCAAVDTDAFVRSAPEAYTSLLFLSAAIAVLGVAFETDFGRGVSDAPLTVAPTLALAVALIARGVAGFLAHASARVDFEVADRASEWPVAVVLVGLFEQRLLATPLARPQLVRLAWLVGVVGVSIGFVLLQALGDAADGVRTQRWPTDLLRIGVPVLLAVIPALLLLRLVLECVQCYSYHAEQRLLPLLITGVFLFCALFFRDTKAFALLDGECELDGRPVPGWRRTRGWANAAYAVGAFAAWWWTYFEETERGAPQLVQLVRREQAASASARTPYVGLPSTPLEGKLGV